MRFAAVHFGDKISWFSIHSPCLCLQHIIKRLGPKVKWDKIGITRRAGYVMAVFQKFKQHLRVGISKTRGIIVRVRNIITNNSITVQISGVSVRVSGVCIIIATICIINTRDIQR